LARGGELQHKKEHIPSREECENVSFEKFNTFVKI